MGLPSSQIYETAVFGERRRHPRHIAISHLISARPLSLGLGQVLTQRSQKPERAEILTGQQHSRPNID